MLVLQLLPILQQQLLQLHQRHRLHRRRRHTLLQLLRIPLQLLLRILLQLPLRLPLHLQHHPTKIPLLLRQLLSRIAGSSTKPPLRPFRLLISCKHLFVCPSRRCGGRAGTPRRLCQRRGNPPDSRQHHPRNIQRGEYALLNTSERIFQASLIKVIVQQADGKRVRPRQKGSRRTDQAACRHGCHTAQSGCRSTKGRHSRTENSSRRTGCPADNHCRRNFPCHLPCRCSRFGKRNCRHDPCCRGTHSGSYHRCLNCYSSSEPDNQSSKKFLPAGVGIGKGVVHGVGIAVEGLAFAVHDLGVGREEATDQRVVEAGVHVDKTNLFEMLV
ncbi:hypothetical protein Barb6XT_03171 [Bacteroidales bacterium Barb6XT]|nr:hypothetical protein Barb6XT_03171 [Bacteroidales bacterium Barb6XT]